MLLPIVIFLAIFQDEVAHQEKMKADKKALEQAKAKAAQKGPMGMSNAQCLVSSYNNSAKPT